jgi:acetoin utilization deacetylase AcuC-like enzyme
MDEMKPKVFCTYQAAPEHRFRGHPESPERIKALGNWLSTPPYPEIQWLAFDLATESDVTLIHQPALLEELEAVCKLGPHQFEPSPSYVTEGSYDVALGAVGATLAVSRRILAEGFGRGFAIVRPPGHHAGPGYSMGFCLLNNIAIAAADAVASGAGRVAIFDFDAHHGNGTEDIFLDTSEVAYCSIHEDDIFPGTGNWRVSENARGRIINVPLPAFSGIAAFNKVLDRIVTPWLASFRPEMLFVSAGYDAHFSDPLTTLTLDTRGIFEVSRRLVDLAGEYCQGRIMFVLEGGYDPVAMKDNIQASLAAMSGQTAFEDHYGQSPDVDPNVNFDALLDDIRAHHHLQEN